VKENTRVRDGTEVREEGSRSCNVAWFRRWPMFREELKAKKKQKKNAL